MSVFNKELLTYLLNNGVIQICPLVLDALYQFVDIQDLGMRWRRTFQSYDVKMMRLTGCSMIFETITASRVDCC